MKVMTFMPFEGEYEKWGKKVGGRLLVSQSRAHTTAAPPPPAASNQSTIIRTGIRIKQHDNVKLCSEPRCSVVLLVRIHQLPIVY